MSEKFERKVKPLFVLRGFPDRLELWVSKITVSYRKVLVILALAAALYAGANSSTVLDWLKTLLALLGG